MRFMVFVRATPQSEAGELPTPQQIDEMTKFNKTLTADIKMVDAGGLQPSSKGVRLSFGSDKGAKQGPFGGGDLVSGYWIVEAPSQDLVVERFLEAPMPHGQSLEVRKLLGPEDFSGR